MFAQLFRGNSTPTTRKTLPSPKTDMILIALKEHGLLTVAMAAGKTGLSVATANSLITALAKRGELRVTRKRSPKREAVVNWYELIEGETKWSQQTTARR